MNISKLLLVLITSLTLFACATTETNISEEAQSAAPPAEKVVATAEAVELARSDVSDEEFQKQLVCTYEKKTGSNMKKRVCRTKQQIVEEREAAQRELGRVIKPAQRPGSQ